MNNRQLLLTVAIFTSFGASLFGFTQQEQEDSLKTLSEKMPNSFLYKKCSEKFSDECNNIADYLGRSDNHVNSRNRIKQLQKAASDAKNKYSKETIMQQVKDEISRNPQYELLYLDKLNQETSPHYLNSLENLNSTILKLVKESENLAKDIDDIMNALNK